MDPSTVVGMLPFLLVSLTLIASVLLSICLLYTSDAGVAFARGAKQLHDNACKNRGFKKRPALVEQNDARLAGHARGTIGGRMGDEQAHGPLQAGIVLQLLDVEVEPGVIQLDCRRPIELSLIHILLPPWQRT